MTKVLSLNGQWTLRYERQTPDAPATPDELASSNWPSVEAHVPGNVELDLMRAGILPDLEVGTNIFRLREYETYRWWYSREFTGPRLTDGESLELQFDGIDCLAWIWINGKLIGQCENGLIEHRFDVTDYVLQDQTNRIDIRLDSALLAGRQRIPEAVETVAGLSSRYEAQAIRKPPHCYGWDIMPRALSAGLWRDVTLRKLPATRLRSVYWFTQSIDIGPGNTKATVGLDWDFCTDQLLTDDLSIRVSLADNGSEVAVKDFSATGTHGRLTLNLDNAKLWWPRGYGR